MRQPPGGTMAPLASASSASLLWRRRCLTAAVFIDLFAVSLVVPLLPMRMKELGVQPGVIGMVGSVYSMAQIVGGLLMGVLADRGLGRRNVLLISFAGAAFS